MCVQPLQVYNATGFPNLVSVTAANQAIFLPENSTLPTVPAPEDVALASGQGALRFLATQTFDQSINSTLTPDEAEACVDAYVDTLADQLRTHPSSHCDGFAQQLDVPCSFMQDPLHHD